ncbi:MAG: GTP pyrophosphokinase [Bacteroides sp.]|nr:GTP pyrophosphokinase [Bacteroides sp.]MCM1550815.1 GTP pyrophosphokinase [Clostridium sp.]
MLEKAIAIAVEAHRGQIDKAGKPYILHPMRVMLAGTNEDEMICGILHDVIEDTPVSIEMLAAEGFSDTILDALQFLTHDRAVPYPEYIQAMTQNPLAVQVKLYDLHDNLNRDRLGILTLEDERRMEKYKKSQEYLLRFLEHTI